MIDLVAKHVVPMAYAVLPKAMQSPEATALLLATGWQESRWEHRRQIKGPARSFLQFEQIAVAEVLSNAKTKEPIRAALKQLGYRFEPTPFMVFEAVEHNDVLALVVGRLNYWRKSGPLPRRDDVDGGWKYYVTTWLPGKPHRDTWAEAWKRGWAALS